MSGLGNFNIDDTLVFTANTFDPTDGAASDLDSGNPAYRVYEDETGTAILTGSMAKLDDANTTGFYSEQLTLSSANGFENGKSYTVYISATVGGVAGTTHRQFTVGVAPTAKARPSVSHYANRGDTLVFPAYDTGLSIYAVFTDANGQVWNGSSMENYATANIGDYDVATTEEGTASQRYAVTVPDMPAGVYRADFYEGSSPAEGDDWLGAFTFGWNGRGFCSAEDAGRVMHAGAVTTSVAGNTTTAIQLDSADSPSTTANFYARFRVAVIEGTNAGIERRITAYNTTGMARLLGVDPAMPAACDATSVVAIYSDPPEVIANMSHGGSATSINAGSGITANITGNLSGSVGSVTGAVGSVTGSVGSVTGNVGGNVVGSVSSVTGDINTAAGTIKNLDALDTAQDSQHSTTQAAIDAVDNFVDTEIAAIIATLGTPSDLGSGATVAANLADIESQTDDIGVAGAGLTAIPWNGTAWDAEVQSEVNDALVALGLDHLLAASVAGTDVTDNSIIAKLVSKSATADWDDFVNTTDSLQALRDHIGDGTNLTEAGGTGDHLTAVPWNSAWAAQVRSAVGLASANLDTQLSAIDNFIDTEIAAIISAIGTPSDLGSGATLADNLADVEALVDGIWTDALTEDYRSHGAAGSGAQILYELLAHMGASSISGATKTTKKVDGSTTAKTYTLTLDGDGNATAITHAS